jgi:hypothetical protein
VHVHVNSHVAASAPWVLTGVWDGAGMAPQINYPVTAVSAIKVAECDPGEGQRCLKWAGLRWQVHWGPGFQPTWEPWWSLALTLQDEWVPNTLWCAFEQTRTGVAPVNPELEG